MLSSVWSWHGGWSTLAFGKRRRWPTERAALFRCSLLPREACGGVICGQLLAVRFSQCTKTETSGFF